MNFLKDFVKWIVNNSALVFFIIFMGSIASFSLSGIINHHFQREIMEDFEENFVQTKIHVVSKTGAPSINACIRKAIALAAKKECDVVLTFNDDDFLVEYNTIKLWTDKIIKSAVSPKAQ